MYTSGLVSKGIALYFDEKLAPHVEDSDYPPRGRAGGDQSEPCELLPSMYRTYITVIDMAVGLVPPFMT